MKTISKAMQTTISRSKYLLLALLVAFNFSCSPEDGNDGAPGEQGIPGTTGTNGADGQDGSANVITSDWLDANWNLLDDDTQKRMRITPDQIGLSNNTLRNDCLIMIYLQQFGTSNIYTIPSKGRWSNTWYSFTYGNNQPNFSGILVSLESTNGVALTENQHAAFRGNSFRYVIVPRTDAKSSLDYSKMTYEEVMNHFDLEL